MKQLSPKRKWLMDTARSAGDAFFNSRTRLCVISRDTVWYALSLLFDDQEWRRDLGKELLRNLQCDDATHTPATLLAMVHNIPELLSADLQSFFMKTIESKLVEATDVQWKDGNVNYPLAAYCTLVCGGALTGQHWAEDIGVRRLHEFRRIIGDRRSNYRRQAEMSEYNSPTYTALDLWFLALIAEHARHEEARKLAHFLEQRLWVDVAMHFHAPSMQFAGPHSRSYQDDSWGGYSALHCTMLAAFDQDLPLFPELAYRYEHPSSLVENALVAIVPFHVPEEARLIALTKPFPYYFRKTTYGESYHENGRSSDGNFVFDDEVYHGGWSDLTTYMTDEFTLGTASLPYVNAGHADSVVVRMRGKGHVQSLNDFRSMYTRGVYNGSKPGQKNHSHVSNAEIDASYLYEEGRCATYQHRNRAIVNYTPKRSGHNGVSSFRTDILFTYANPFDVLLVNGQAPSVFPIDLPPHSRIIFQSYQMLGAIIILGVEPNSSSTPIRLWECNGYLIISIYNYEGQERDFAREEIVRWRTGFVIELANRNDFASFENFRTHVESMEVSEEIRLDASRSTTVKDETDRMEFCYDPLREIVLSRRWNDVEERVEHLSIECGDSSGRYSPPSLFGHELFDSTSS